MKPKLGKYLCLMDNYDKIHYLQTLSNDKEISDAVQEAQGFWRIYNTFKPKDDDEKALQMIAVANKFLPESLERLGNMLNVQTPERWEVSELFHLMDFDYIKTDDHYLNKVKRHIKAEQKIDLAA